MSERFALINHEKFLVSRISFAWQKGTCLLARTLSCQTSENIMSTVCQQYDAVLFTTKIYMTA
jgi:hypothetical protein